jgi:single-stranded DNA-binding protein
MMSLTIGGRLGADPTMGDAGGTAVCNFSVAVDGWDPKAREKMTTWVRVAVFGKRAESLQTILSKGSSVMCAGEARLTEYKGKQYLELTANAVTLMGSKPADAAPPAVRKAAARHVDPDGEPPF